MDLHVMQSPENRILHAADTVNLAAGENVTIKAPDATQLFKEHPPSGKVWRVQIELWIYEEAAPAS